MERVILHSDLNNCYASIECMLHPELRGKYIAVCGNTAERHGIVLAKNQLAKQCGVKTGDAILCEAKHKFTYEKKDIMRRNSGNPWSMKAFITHSLHNIINSLTKPLRICHPAKTNPALALSQDTHFAKPFVWIQNRLVRISQLFSHHCALKNL